MDYLSQKHKVVVFTSNAEKLDSFWNDSIKTIGNPTEKNYQVKRYSILQPSKVPTELYDLPFTIGSPGPFCPDMWHDLLNLEEKPDLIIATAFPYNHIIPAFLASKKYKIPIIVIPHLHLEFPELYFTGIRIALLQGSDMIVVNTETEKQALLHYGISSDKIRIIPPAIAIQQNANSTNLRKKLNLGENLLIVLSAGTKSYAKGTMNLIEAMKKLWDKSLAFELILIGPSMNDFKRYLEKLERKYAVHIHDLGLVSDNDKWNAFSSCDIFALPSKSESFGISYLEAWLNKKPVIGCNIDAVKDLINDNEDGLLVEFSDIERLSESIEKLQDQNLRNTLGTNGYEKLASKYELQNICKQFEEVCNSMLEMKLHG